MHEFDDLWNPLGLDNSLFTVGKKSGSDGKHGFSRKEFESFVEENIKRGKFTEEQFWGTEELYWKKRNIHLLPMEQRLEMLFNAGDKDNSGHISLSELTKFWRNLGLEGSDNMWTLIKGQFEAGKPGMDRELFRQLMNQGISEKTFKEELFCSAAKAYLFPST